MAVITYHMFLDIIYNHNNISKQKIWVVLWCVSLRFYHTYGLAVPFSQSPGKVSTQMQATALVCKSAFLC